MGIITQISKEMKRVLAESADRAAQVAGLIQRQRKVNSRNLGQTLIMGWWQEPNISLEGLTQIGKSLGLAITAQGLDQRFNETTATYLREVLQAIVQIKIENKGQKLPTMGHFTQVYVEDSSIVTFMKEIKAVWQGIGGNGTTSGVKLQTRVELKAGCLDGPHLSNSRLHDRQAAQVHIEVETGALHLRDLGYWNLAEWEQANERDFYLLSLMKTSTCFWHDEQSYDCYRWCKNVEGDRFDIPILLGKKAKIPARLLGKRVSDEVAAQRRRKLKRASQKRGQTVSYERLLLCAWTLVVTNAAQEMVTTKDAFVWLGVRWQIELLFKLWKSVGCIDKSRSAKPWRQLCEFYAKLSAMTLQHWLLQTAVWQFPDRSLTKASQTIRLHVIRLATALGSQTKLSRIIKEICQVLATGCRINRSRKQPRTWQKLELLQAQPA